MEAPRGDDEIAALGRWLGDRRGCGRCDDRRLRDRAGGHDLQNTRRAQGDGKADDEPGNGPGEMTLGY